MSLPHQPRRRVSRAALVAAAAVLTVGTVGVATFAGAAGGATTLALSGSLYVDSTSQVVKWVAANPNDSRTPVIRNRIASQPQAHWFSSFNVSTIQSSVASYVSAAGSQVPVLVAYGITNRDCGGASAGGAPDLATYATWISNLAAGLGSSSSIVILEPDSIALQTCLSAAEVTARDNAIAAAVTKIKSTDANAKVYLDAGHSAWNSASTQAARLVAAGVTSSNGIFSNVSNFNTTSNEVAYVKSVLSSIGGSNLHAVIDTSRNGNGSNGEWCDPSGRMIGQYPTLATGDSLIDGYLWIKPPGEADGCAATAGTFVADLAYALAVNAANPPATTAPATTTPATTTAAPTSTPPTTTAPVTTTPVTTTPAATTPAATTPASTASCAVAYRLDSSWSTGFVANVTLTNRGAAISSWTLAFSYAGNQKVSSAWNATVTQSGTTVTATSLSYNGSLPTGTSTSFGFQGTYSGTNTAPTSFTLNGTACSAG